MKQEIYQLDWVDEFIHKIKPYVYVREIDHLLILIPNQMHRLNKSGFAVLDYLLKGNPMDKLLVLIGDSDEKRRELHHFFCDLRALVSGCIRDNEKREAVTYYEYSGDLTQYPVLSEIAVTYRCNLNCEFCYVGDRDYRELSPADFKKILFKIFHEAKIPSVSFTGGEPLLYRNIIELIEYASGIGMWTNLITNGTMLNAPYVENLKKIGLSSVQVSLEGPTPEVHDKITGVPGSFLQTTANIKLLIKEGIPTHTNTTVSRTNVDHLIKLMEFVRSLGLTRLSMNLLIPCGAAAKKKDLWVSYADIGDIVLKLKKAADEIGLRFIWYSPVPMCTFNPIAHGFGNKSCAAVTGLLSIDPLGNVLPCSSWREPVGSLLRKSFKSIWESPMLAYFKNGEYAPDECKGCQEFGLCKGGCPLYWKVNKTTLPLAARQKQP